ncbi:MAG: methyltransferase domain-containing protein [Bacilli bacterium]|nr:methyltransferase domain-containing protein [Bacilli bacterium]
MKNKEYEFYESVKNWDFSMINYEEEFFTNWNMFDVLKKHSKNGSRILDLGTGGGEKVLEFFPNNVEILGTDFSSAMIETANFNLKKSGRKNIKFRVMDNYKMDTELEYYDIVVARNTCIDPKQIYKTLKKNGVLIVRGVDKLDCWQLKRMFGMGQEYKDKMPTSLIDYENILNASFKNVELIPLYVKEYYKSKDDLLALLYKVPILDYFDTNKDKIDMDLINKYILENTCEKGILLRRRYYGIIAYK